MRALAARSLGAGVGMFDERVGRMTELQARLQIAVGLPRDPDAGATAAMERDAELADLRDEYAFGITPKRPADEGDQVMQAWTGGEPDA